MEFKVQGAFSNFPPKLGYCETVTLGIVFTTSGVCSYLYHPEDFSAGQVESRKDSFSAKVRDSLSEIIVLRFQTAGRNIG